jgi:hypothetical protein
MVKGVARHIRGKSAMWQNDWQELLTNLMLLSMTEHIL